MDVRLNELGLQTIIENGDTVIQGLPNVVIFKGTELNEFPEGSFPVPSDLGELARWAARNRVVIFYGQEILGDPSGTDSIIIRRENGTLSIRDKIIAPIVTCVVIPPCSSVVKGEHIIDILSDNFLEYSYAVSTMSVDNNQISQLELEMFMTVGRNDLERSLLSGSCVGSVTTEYGVGDIVEHFTLPSTPSIHVNISEIIDWFPKEGFPSLGYYSHISDENPIDMYGFLDRITDPDLYHGRQYIFTGSEWLELSVRRTPDFCSGNPPPGVLANIPYNGSFSGESFSDFPYQKLGYGKPFKEIDRSIWKARIQGIGDQLINTPDFISATESWLDACADYFDSIDTSVRRLISINSWIELDQSMNASVINLIDHSGMDLTDVTQWVNYSTTRFSLQRNPLFLLGCLTLAIPHISYPPTTYGDIGKIDDILVGSLSWSDSAANDGIMD
jgi:hypothetical protein